MDEDDTSAVAALRRIADYLNVPIEGLFGSPVKAPSSGRECVSSAEVHALVRAFTMLDDSGARKRVIEAATAEVEAEQKRTRARKP